MDRKNLDTTADSLVDFFLLVRNNIFSQEDFLKNFNDFQKKFDGKMSDITPLPLSNIKVIIYLSTVKTSSISQIAMNLGISKPNMTPIIDNLLEYGLITRFSDPKDRRILRVQLTQKALDIFDFFKDSAKDSLKYKISSLSDEDLYELNNHVSGLQKILGKLK